MLSGVILKVKHSTGPQWNGCSDTRPPDACIQGRSWHQSISLKFLLYFSLKRITWKEVLAFSLGGPMSPIWARYAAGYNHARTLSFPTSTPSGKLPCLPKRLSPSLSSWKTPIHPSRCKVWSMLWQTFHLLFAPDPPPPPRLPSRVRVPCPVYVTGAFPFQCLLTTSWCSVIPQRCPRASLPVPSLNQGLFCSLNQYSLSTSMHSKSQDIKA